MWIFVSILFLVGAVHFILNLSLIKNLWIRMAVILCTALANFALHPFSKSINAGWFINYLNDYNLLSLACTIQVTDSFLVLIAAIIFLKSKNLDSKIPIWGYFSLFPSPIFFAGLFMIQTGALYYVNGIEFHWTCIILAAAVFVVLGPASLLAVRITGTDINRLEFKVYLSILQLILAMFLPVTIKGGAVQATQFDLDMFQVISVWGVILMVCVLGFYWTHLGKKLKPNGRIHRFILYRGKNLAAGGKQLSINGKIS